MLQIEIDRLNKHYGHFHALQDVTINIKNGSFVALVGPSGCGKSTLLRTLAGLEKSTSGEIRIAGERVNDKPPRERDVAMVFQSYALYPHMNVERNMNYALRLRRRPAEEIAQRTQAAAKTLGLGALLDRLPRQLSGGQRQRVAMGRAIVRDPKVFLFDEPLSNLDAALRVHMRSEIRKLHERLHATSVYVTHDQIEAMTMADHIVVMRAGIIEQQGAPLDLYDRPANKFVAGFIGSPAMNFLPAIVNSDGRSIALTLTEPQSVPIDQQLTPGHKVWLGLRPEHLTLETSPAAVSIRTKVDAVESTGSMTFLTVLAHPAALVVARNGRLPVGKGETITIHVDRANMRLFDFETERAL